MSATQLNPKEQEKATILQSAIAGRITNEQAGRQLKLSVRQVQRVKSEIRKNGIDAVIHKLKGKPGNARLPEAEKANILETIKKDYSDFKPTFATEKLAEKHDVHISRETTRLWMIQEGLWKTKKAKKPEYHAWRPRKEFYGELEQFDGSYHMWFENRFVDRYGSPIEVCLLASIDDATSEITRAIFAANEGVVAVFLFWKAYAENRGKSIAVYLDKFSTYKINHKSAVDNHELMTQFQRLMQDLGIELISAHSPQAKGRIERLFKTLQDRLVKEMRLADINTPEEGNKFLERIFIPKFNKQFGVAAEKEGDLHKALSKTDKQNINRIFSIQSERVVNNDFTIQFKTNWYQLAEIQPTTVRAKQKVLVEEWLDGTIHFSLRGKYLKYILLPKRPDKIKRNPIILTTHKLNYKPPLNHPWRKPYKAKS